MTEGFAFDVFLSYSSKDRAVVRALAERLRADGIRVWFDGWVLKPGDSIPAKIDEGLEQSRVLVLCMSAHASGSDWARLEAGTFRFRDPLNRELRFIPLRLDDAPIKGSLAQFLYIDWRSADRESEYAKLLEGCRRPAESAAVPPDASAAKSTAWEVQLQGKNFFTYAFHPEGTQVLTGQGGGMMGLWDLKMGRRLRAFQGHTKEVRSIAWSNDHGRALSASDDRTLRLWDIETGECLRVLRGHARGLNGVVWRGGRHAVSVADDEVRLWNVNTGRCLQVFQGHTDISWGVAWSEDETAILSCSRDGTVRLWAAETGQCLHVFKGHENTVWSVAWIDDRHFVSGSKDKTVRLWDARTRRCLRVLEGDTSSIRVVAGDGKYGRALSGSDDGTVRIWDLTTGHCVPVCDGHKVQIRGVAWSGDRGRMFSGDQRGRICAWNLSELVSPVRAAALSVSPLPAVPRQVQYTNAKVLLVGDSGVGKSGLSNYLAHGIKVEDGRPIPSTDGTWATHWPLPDQDHTDGVDREIWLWDFAGQVDYRLVHQLFMEDAAAVVLVFNPQSENPFEGLGHWDRDLQKAARKPFAKLLVAGRIDRGGLVISAARLQRFMADRGFLAPLHLTSAKTGDGCDQLREAIVQAIDWKSIPETTSPALYHRLKQEILKLRDTGLVLIRVAELNQRMEMTLTDEPFELAQLETVVNLLAGPGMIQRLEFGGFILLRPEVLSRYAAAVVRKVRQHPHELGCIREDDMLAGDLDYQDFQPLLLEDEAVVLRALLDTFVSRAWCLRQPSDNSALLTFPSYFRRERKDQPSHPSVLVTYRFTGPTDDIYATLVVKLHHTVAFQSTDLWKSAADFQTQTGAALGFTLVRESEGTSRLEAYFEPGVDDNSRVLFLRYVHDHLVQHAQDVVRLRHYVCANKKCDSFDQPVVDQAKIDKALAPGGKGKVFCPDCGKMISLRDAIEQKFNSPAVRDQVRALQLEGQAVIDSESGELLAAHHTAFIVAEAGQIYRPYSTSDRGIDAEIEFNDDDGRPSGARLYVQLKSSASYLRQRQRDGEPEVFQIKEPQWATYWQQQARPVMLVVRGPDGEIRWMNVSSYLWRESDRRKKPVNGLIFNGESLDVMSVIRWRDRVLGSTRQAPPP
jgi:WD40 repeat protein